MQMSRRRALMATGAAALGAAIRTPPVVAADKIVKNGRLKQSVSRWCYNSIPMPDFCRAVADMGLTAIDLLEEPDWAVAREHGLICSMGYAGGGSIRDGLNVTANHMDRYGGLADYAAAKARIFARASVQILNRDDAIVRLMRLPGRTVQTFGESVPLSGAEKEVYEQVVSENALRLHLDESDAVIVHDRRRHPAARPAPCPVPC